jgi:hypothetical protein
MKDEMAVHVLNTTEMRNAYRVLLGSLKGIDHLEDLELIERIILKCTLRILGHEGVDWINFAFK